MKWFFPLSVNTSIKALEFRISFFSSQFKKKKKKKLLMSASILNKILSSPTASTPASNRAPNNSNNDDDDDSSSYFQRTVKCFLCFMATKSSSLFAFFFTDLFLFLFLQKVCLFDWWLIKAEKDFQGMRVAVAGFTSRE